MVLIEFGFVTFKSIYTFCRKRSVFLLMTLESGIRVFCVSCATLCFSEFKTLQYFHLFNQQKSLQIKQKLGTTLLYIYSTCLKCNNFTVDTCITKRTYIDYIYFLFVGLQMFSTDCVLTVFK